MSQGPMVVDVVADVVCPWCYLGWRRLKTAIALRPDVDAKLIWRPYQLDPSIPRKGPTARPIWPPSSRTPRA
jgi:predicted DsbA family dithiol-disulfide isomerase